MASAFEDQIRDPKTYHSLSFEERFGLLVDSEWAMRQVNKLNRLIKKGASLVCVGRYLGLLQVFKWELATQQVDHRNEIVYIPKTSCT